MLENKKILVVLPAYNAAKTLTKTYNKIPKNIVDEIILVDDCSSDETINIAKQLGLNIFYHSKNLGYGANQKTCYKEALKTDADIIIMLHPDYQYPPQLITAMAGLITSGLFDIVLGSRILGKSAIIGGMPKYKYIANRILTFIENILLQQKLSEYHTGYRAYTREVLETLPIMENSDDFVFDNQMLSQIVYAGYDIAEVSCPTKYFEEASSINLKRSTEYGLGVMLTSFKHFFQRTGLAKYKMYEKP